MRYLSLLLLAALASLCGCDRASRQPDSSSSENTAPTAIDRRALFEQYCASCHGINGTEPVNNAANLAESHLDEASIRQLIRTGRRTMPGFETMLSAAQIDSLVLHVRYLQH